MEAQETAFRYAIMKVLTFLQSHKAQPRLWYVDLSALWCQCSSFPILSNIYILMWNMTAIGIFMISIYT